LVLLERDMQGVVGKELCVSLRARDDWMGVRKVRGFVLEER
jgi:hypothetical protein